MSLYSLTGEMLELIGMLEAGEIPEEAISDTLEALSGEWNTKADSIISAIKNINVEAEGIKAEIEALSERLARKKATVARLEEYLTSSMLALNMPRYESARHDVRFRKSYRAKITDESALLEWAKENAPDIIKHGADTISKDKVKRLATTVNVPFYVAEEVNNIQIK
jgi:chromosome segregation ATPase